MLYTADGKRFTTLSYRTHQTKTHVEAGGCPLDNISITLMGVSGLLMLGDLIVNPQTI